MPAEIERKFLIVNDSWRAEVVQTEYLRDGLIARFGGGKVRVRQAEDRAWIAIKGPRRGLTRAEYEYEVPTAEAAEMLDTLCQGQVVEKVRHCVPFEGQVWSIDIYQGSLAGIVLAEVELNSADEVVRAPAWAGREVTQDPQFSKEALVRSRM